MKLYLVWSGIYEDADVEAIFDNLEETKRFVHENWREYEFALFVEERPLGVSSYCRRLYSAEILGCYEDERELKVEKDWVELG